MDLIFKPIRECDTMDDCETPEEFAWYLITHCYGHSPDLDEIANAIRAYHEKQLEKKRD